MKDLHLLSIDKKIKVAYEDLLPLVRQIYPEAIMQGSIKELTKYLDF